MSWRGHGRPCPLPLAEQSQPLLHQAANDFLVFGSVALCALTSGALHERFGWDALNLVLVPFMGLTLAAILWLEMRRRPPAAA